MTLSVCGYVWFYYKMDNRILYNSFVSDKIEYDAEPTNQFPNNKWGG